MSTASIRPPVEADARQRLHHLEEIIYLLAGHTGQVHTDAKLGRGNVTPDHGQALARYNRWMNAKVYAVASQLTDGERKRDRGAFFKSIHATLNHILLADRVWMGRFTGANLEGGWLGPGGIRSLDQELYSDYEELRRERATMDSEIESWVADLTVEKLTAPLGYVRKDVAYEFPLWWAVAQLFNHQTHHRGQVTTLLMQSGYDPGVTDLIAMFWEEGARARQSGRVSG